jgi:hypothetical protein
MMFSNSDFDFGFGFGFGFVLEERRVVVLPTYRSFRGRHKAVSLVVDV